MLYSVIKIPRLCDEFHKALLRKKKQDTELAQGNKSSTKQEMEMECYHYLKKHISRFPTEKAFLNNLASYIDRVNWADAVQPETESRENTINSVSPRSLLSPRSPPPASSSSSSPSIKSQRTGVHCIFSERHDSGRSDRTQHAQLKVLTPQQGILHRKV